MRYFKQYEEVVGRSAHRLLNDDDRPAFVPASEEVPVCRGPCRYTVEGVACKVPPGHYFMMGDNRDNSLDSPLLGLCA